MAGTHSITMCLCLCVLGVSRVQPLQIEDENNLSWLDAVLNHSKTIQARDDDFNQLVNDYALGVYILVHYCIVNSLMNIFGIITNVINIIVFIKQGFRETINVSLCGLSISDLCSLITLQWANICLSPSLMLNENLPFVSLDMAYITAGWPRKGFTRITAWITAYITFERCVCIVFPLKVKILFTPKRTFIIVISIFIVVLTSISPVFYTSRLVWLTVPGRNQTRLGLTFTSDRESVESVVYLISNVCFPILALASVMVCTAILAFKLNSQAKWRQSSASTTEKVTRKDINIIKMVSSISTIFIICLFPDAILFSAMACVPQLSVDGKYCNLFLVCTGVCFFLESINSSINIFLYFNMSSKYRVTFFKLFHVSD